MTDYQLALLCQRAYNPSEDLHSVENIQWLVHYDRARNETVLAFRGTDEIRDWLTNLNTTLRGTIGGSRVHGGFLWAATVIWREIHGILVDSMDWRHSGDTLYLTGHSLGGALAQIVALKLVLEEDIAVQRVVTFGSPRVGDRQFVAAIQNRMGPHLIRYVNQDDLVTRVPPGVFGYKHAGQLRYITGSGKIIDQPSIWRRFKDRIKVTMAHVGTKGLSSIEHHSIDDYVAGLAPSASEPPLGEHPMSEENRTSAGAEG